MEKINDEQRLREVPESHATGRVAEIYDEIRHFSGVPVVALIYRHMATLPDVLEWVWRWQRPLMVSGLLQEKAWKLLSHKDLPSIHPLPLLARQATGITEAEEDLIAKILASFNRLNPINVLALCCLERYLHGTVETIGRLEVRQWTPPGAFATLPPIYEIDKMDSTTRAIVGWLSHRGRGRYAGIWPSLYRYFAYVPQYLGLAAVILTPHLDSIDCAVTEIHSKIGKAADDLVAQVPPPDPIAPSGSQREALERAIRNFTFLIPEAMVVGALLERATLRR